MGRSRTRLKPLFDIEVNIDNYWSKVDKSGGPNACWPYTGPKHVQGYGFIGARRIADDKRLMVVAHRVAARIKEGRAIGSKEMVIHSCSNPNCQNFSHLVIGNARKRNEIMYANGRGPTPLTGKGVRNQKMQNRKYKHTIEEMLFIKHNPIKETVKRFGVDKKKASCWKRGYIDGYAWLKDYEDK